MEHSIKEHRAGYLSLLRSVVFVMAAIVALTMSHATPALATTSQQGQLSYESALDQSLNVIEGARAADPGVFDRKVELVTSSSATIQFLEAMSYREMTAERQAELFAATADIEVIQGLVYGSEMGYITAVEDGGTRTLTVDGPSPNTDKGGASTAAVAFPQCPSAWGCLYGLVYYHLSVLRRRHDPGFLVGTCMRWFDFLGKFGDRFQWWLLTPTKEDEK